MMRKIRSHLSPVVLLIGGTILLAAAGLFQNLGIPQWASLLLLFLTYNVFIAKQFGLLKRLFAVWSFKKIHHFVFGFLIGTVPIAVAIGFLFLDGTIRSSSIKPISPFEFLATVAIVSWEELWFRGIVLDLAAFQYSKLGAAVVFGSLFVALHLLNPDIQILKEGPELFLAGYSLSLCYFLFESIWAPIGMHFANNAIEAIFGMSTEPTSAAYVLALLTVSIFLTVPLCKRRF